VVDDGSNIPVEITGDLLICPGASTPLEAGPVAFETYEWNTGETTAFITASVGTYTVTVTNGLTCVGTATVTVGEAVPPTPIITGAAEICVETSTDLDAGNGYDAYAWSTGEDTQTINVTMAGDYTVTVTDAEGCEGAASFSVSVLDLPLEITGDTELCEGESTTLSANTQGAVIWYDDNNTQLGTGPSLALTPAGLGTFTYVAQAVDNVCTTTDTVEVTVSAYPELTVSSDEVACQGDEVTISAIIDMGTLVWEPANELSDPTVATQVVSPFSTTTYTVTADNNGCSVQGDVTVTIIPPPVYDVIPSTSICLGDAITLGTVADASTTYQWTASPADPSLTDPTSAVPSVSPTGTTTYTLTATRDGCSETQTVTISVVEPSISVNDATICAGDFATLEATVAPAGGTVTWTDWEGNVVGVGEQIEVDPSGTTTYNANYVVNGCSVNAFSEVTVIEEADITISADPGAEVPVGVTVTLTASGAPAGSTFTWIADNDANPQGDETVTVTPPVTTTYSVQVTSPEGCVYSASITIVVIPLDFSVPNVFSPNNDGLNDDFYPVYDDLSLEILEFKVFDRWGELVHEDVSTGWDGTHNGKLMPSDIYVYFVRVKYIDGVEEMRKGDVNLLR
jgi:gliding motility-associated-like protein